MIPSERRKMMRLAGVTRELVGAETGARVRSVQNVVSGVTRGEDRHKGCVPVVRKFIWERVSASKHVMEIHPDLTFEKFWADGEDGSAQRAA